MSANSLVKSTHSGTEEATCLDCGWSSKDGQHSTGARQSAYNHTFYSGHRTVCKRVQEFQYMEDAA